MVRPKIVAMCFLAAGGVFAATVTYVVHGQTAAATEAAAGFDSKTNGYLLQADFAAARQTFQERDGIGKGLGPVYNAQSCAECHQSPVSGGISQITEVRAGYMDANGNFVAPPGGTLINDRSIHSAIQEYVPRATAGGQLITTLRVSTNTLGLGFVEAIASETLTDLANAEPDMTRTYAGVVKNLGIHGQTIQVHMLEAPDGDGRIGRFGWKDQHGSLLSFAADAYLNEIGITSRLLPAENTSLGDSVADYDTVADPEDVDNDIDAFAAFMRSTKVPPRDDVAAATTDAQAGSGLFNQIGCNACHTRTFTTAAPGTVINDGQFVVPDALGNKIIHPFSDFLLHDIGTGDGIVQGDAPGNTLRTAPLWGLRTRLRRMHDGASLTVLDAIRRHGGEAAVVVDGFKALTGTQRMQLLAFLDSL